MVFEEFLDAKRVLGVLGKRLARYGLTLHPDKTRVDLRSPSLYTRLPTPVTAKAGPVPTHQRLRPDDRENLQD
jgi:hypothetical protein